MQTTLRYAGEVTRVSADAEVERRARRYWYEDGLAEIGLGIVFGAVGLALAMQTAAAGGPFAPLGVILMVLVVPLGMLALHRGIRASKERLTYPRTGYVAYRRPAAGRRLLLVLVLLLGLVAARSVAADIPARVIVVQALTMAALLLVPALRFGVFRFYVLATVAVTTGWLVLLVNASQTGRTALLCGGMAVALAVSGLWTLRSYLRATSLTDEPGR